MPLTNEQRKAMFAKKHDPAMEKTLSQAKLMAKTSGKMGIKSTEFAMFAGKVVTPSEKIKLEKQKEEKEARKKTLRN